MTNSQSDTNINKAPSHAQQFENFRQDLRELINKYSRENQSSTPDFVLAQYLTDCLDAFDKAVHQRQEYLSADRSDSTG